MLCHAYSPLTLRSVAALALGLGTLLSFSGCGQNFKRLEVFPVKGKITYQGKAPEGAVVVLHPVGDSDPNIPRPSAKVGSDGTFVVKTYDPGDGAPAGKYKVTVQLRKFEQKEEGLVAGPSLVPEKYASVDKTDLEVEVAAAPTNDLAPITLRR